MIRSIWTQLEVTSWHLAMVLLSACSTNGARFPAETLAGLRAPPAELVAHVETLLSRQSCIGALDRWHRVYRWRTFPGDFVGMAPPPDESQRTSLLEVRLREAGQFGFVAGAVVEPIPDRPAENEIVMAIDGRQSLYARATYDVQADRLRDVRCRRNRG
jgi:hypothetical protein